MLIVGGALQKENSEVYSALVNSMLPEGPLVIIPAASGRPARSAESFAEDLADHGLASDRVVIFPLAVKDDSKTGDVDESTWSQNAWQEELLTGVRNAAGFWFTGGDQSRITETMVNEEGEESPLLILIRSRLIAGAVVGGSSAGAAIMSHDMIAGGVSFTSLLEPLAESYASIEAQDSGRLYVSKGLGFLPEGIVDQHFDRKARLGRLVRAMAATGQVRGFGIDENTALLIQMDEQVARVLGSGNVTLLDASKASYSFGSPQLARQLSLSVMASGVSFRMGDFLPVEGQGAATLGNEYFGYQPIDGGGMAFANQRLDQSLGFDLLDNSKSREIKRYSIDERGRVLIYHFIKTPNSKGFWRKEGSADRYTISNVRFDILQSSVSMQID